MTLSDLKTNHADATNYLGAGLTTTDPSLGSLNTTTHHLNLLAGSLSSIATSKYIFQKSTWTGSVWTFTDTALGSVEFAANTGAGSCIVAATIKHYYKYTGGPSTFGVDYHGSFEIESAGGNSTIKRNLLDNHESYSAGSDIITKVQGIMLSYVATAAQIAAGYKVIFYAKPDQYGLGQGQGSIMLLNMFGIGGRV